MLRFHFILISLTINILTEAELPYVRLSHDTNITNVAIQNNEFEITFILHFPKLSSHIVKRGMPPNVCFFHL